MTHRVYDSGKKTTEPVKLSVGMSVYWFTQSGEGGRYEDDDAGCVVNWDDETVCVRSDSAVLFFRPSGEVRHRYPEILYLDSKYTRELLAPEGSTL